MDTGQAHRFDGKVAIITGGAGGIGLACASRFATEGSRVVIADIDEGAGKAAASTLESLAPAAWACRCDVSDEAQVSACVEGTVQRFGRLDVIVNNAGFMTFKPILQLARDDWYQVLGIDLVGAFYFIKHGFRLMKPGGAIVNVASVHARETTPLVSPYAAAKAGLVSLTRSAALEGKPRGIRVNAVLPGAIDTPMLWENPNVRSGVEHLDKSMIGQPEDIAAAVAFLAADEARFIQGTALVVDGGQLDRL